MLSVCIRARSEDPRSKIMLALRSLIPWYDRFGPRLGTPLGVHEAQLSLDNPNAIDNIANTFLCPNTGSPAKLRSRHCVPLVTMSGLGAEKDPFELLSSASLLPTHFRLVRLLGRGSHGEASVRTRVIALALVAAPRDFSRPSWPLHLCMVTTWPPLPRCRRLQVFEVERLADGRRYALKYACQPPKPPPAPRRPHADPLPPPGRPPAGRRACMRCCPSSGATC